jgi:hypothetical protein
MRCDVFRTDVNETTIQAGVKIDTMWLWMKMDTVTDMVPSSISIEKCDVEMLRRMLFKVTHHSELPPPSFLPLRSRLEAAAAKLEGICVWEGIIDRWLVESGEHKRFDLNRAG